MLKNLMITLVFGVVVSLTATASHAALFKYSFTSTGGNTLATVAGEITLADGDGIGLQATSVTINQISYTDPDAPIYFHFFDIPLEFAVVVGDSGAVYSNRFDVLDGEITDFNFDALARRTSPVFHQIYLVIDDSVSEAVDNEFHQYYDPSSLERPTIRSGSIQVERISAVPEPSTIALFGLALVGLSFTRRRRQA